MQPDVGTARNASNTTKIARFDCKLKGNEWIRTEIFSNFAYPHTGGGRHGNIQPKLTYS